MSANSDRIVDIFNQARAKAPGEDRQRFLDEACRNYPDWRPEIDSMLRAYDAEGEGQGQPLETTRVVPELITEKPGDRIDRYKLLEKIGEGGMGAVWMAEQTEPVRRRVALKLIKQGMDSGQVLARFEAERQALALMDHPHIAKVLDAGATAAGRPYFVMELVKGIPLTKFCDDQRLSIRERLELFVPICQAIQHAHQKGIIHRDIKPSNVLVAMYDGAPVPKVIDFGVAKAIGQQLTERTLFTGFGAVIGTLEYMSPEQAEFNQLDIDTRSDIYSLGVLLYELLTGTTPITHDTIHKAAFDEVIRRIREEEPPRPSTRLSESKDLLPAISAQRKLDPAQLPKLIRGDLDWIVMKCLEKDRRRRYETANGLASDLQRHLTNEPVLARPPSNLYRFQKMARRNKIAFAAAAAVAIAIVLGFGLSTWSFVKERQALRRAIAAEEEQVTQRQRAESNALAESRQRLRADQLAAEELKQRQRAEDAAVRLQLARAEDFFAHGDSQMGLAYLAMLLRKDPSNRVAAERCWAALSYRTFPTPIALSSGSHFVRLSPDSSRVLTSNGEIWHARSSEILAKLSARRGSPFTCAQFNSAGTDIVTGDDDGNVHLWDAHTGTLKSALAKHAQRVWSVRFSPDGEWIASAAWDKTARLSNARSGELLGNPMRLPGNLRDALFSPDGQRLVTTSDDGTVQLWDPRSTQPLAPPFKHRNIVWSVHFTPDGERFATASWDGTARILDAKTGCPLVDPLQHDWLVYDARFSSDGKRLVTASGDETIRVWDAHTGRLLCGPIMQNSSSHSARFSADGERIVTAATKNVRVWNAWTGEPLTEPIHISRSHGPVTAEFAIEEKTVLMTCTEFSGFWHISAGKPRIVTLVHENRSGSTYSSPIYWAELSPSGQLAVTASLDTTARIWDAHTGKEVTSALKHSSRVWSARFSQDNKRVVTASDDRTARIWDAASGHPLGPPLSHSNAVYDAQFSPSGSIIATVCSDAALQLWTAQTGGPVTNPLNLNLPLPRTSLHNRPLLKFSPNGERVLCATYDGDIRIWETRTGKAAGESISVGPQVKCIDFSPNGRWIAAAFHSGVAFFDLREASVHRHSVRFEEPAHVVRFSPNGTNVLVVSDNMVRLIAVPTGDLLLEPFRHAQNRNLPRKGGNRTEMRLATFSRNGQRIVTASADGIVQVWDAGTGHPLAEPFKHEDEIDSGKVKDMQVIQFSPDGQRLLTASTWSARIWEIPSPPVPAPSWLPTLAETLGCKRVDDPGLTKSVSPQQFFAVKKLLLTSSQRDYWTHWGKWFVSDRLTGADFVPVLGAPDSAQSP
jgi:eukaryotic-like serine/threonine-protein kinase